MRFLRDTPKMLLRVKALRRFLSILVLTLADGAALVLGLLGAAYLGGGRVADLVPLLLAAWISVFAIFRLYDRAHSRRDPAALVGAALSWAALVAAAAAIYPESGLELGSILLAAFLALLCAGTFRLLY
ncbi:MAG TPA: hypothetical protein VIZ59_05100, partial [Rubrobacteraceae bacterium]